MRLNKYLSEQGECSRREADRLIEEGRVVVNGVVAGIAAEVPDGARVEVDGEVISKRVKKDGQEACLYRLQQAGRYYLHNR
jgi:ribosomal large subunit pseudouridine synthase F (EC 5.4.99.-)